MSEHYRYTDAFEELQVIVAEIERGDISIDDLSDRVKRAALLISICKSKLSATEADVNHILATLMEPTPAEAVEEGAPEPASPEEEE